MNVLAPYISPRVSLGLLILRVAVGASFLVHGAPKLAHPTSWMGAGGPLPGVPAWLQLVVTITENLGGLCILLGFLTPLFAFLQACDMLVAGFLVKAGHGLPYVGPQGRNFEIEAHLFATSLVFLLCGPGLYALDAALAKLRDRVPERIVSSRAA